MSASASATPAPSETTSASAAPIRTHDPAWEVQAIVSSWDAAYSAHDPDKVVALYTPTVRYYGVPLSQADCKKKIAQYVSGAPDLSRASTIDAITTTPTGVRVSLTTTQTAKGKTKKYPGYFHLTRGQSGALRIDEESDPVTDSVLARGTCEDMLAKLARGLDTTGTQGTVSFTPPTSANGRYRASFMRQQGSSDVEVDPKTGVIYAGMGDDLPPLAHPSPTIQKLADSARAACK